MPGKETKRNSNVSTCFIIKLTLLHLQLTSDKSFWSISVSVYFIFGTLCVSETILQIPACYRNSRLQCCCLFLQEREDFSAALINRTVNLMNNLDFPVIPTFKQALEKAKYLLEAVMPGFLPDVSDNQKVVASPLVWSPGPWAEHCHSPTASRPRLGNLWSLELLNRNT